MHSEGNAENLRAASHQSSVPSTPTVVGAPMLNRGAEGRLSALTESSDMDSFKNMMNSRGASVVAGSSGTKVAWVKGTVSRPSKSAAPNANARFVPVSARAVSPVARPLSPTSTQPQHSTTAASHSNRIGLSHLTVEETIHLRHIFDQFIMVDASASPAADVEPSGVEATVSRALDVFTVTALLHHAKVLHALPPDTELRKMIVRVAVTNAQVVAKATNSDSIAVAAVEPVVEFPSELTFPLFLQLVELCKRWARREDDEDEVAKAYAFYTKNRRYIKAVDDATIQAILSAGKWSSTFQPQWSSTPSMFSVSSHVISPSTLDLEHPCTTPQPGAAPATTAAPAPASNNDKAPSLLISNLQDILKSVGAQYDFQTLFASVDPRFGEEGKIDQRLFRWVAGVDDPDIVRAFVSLGGEEGLSGTITVESLIAKCEAMQMTPQYIANFVTLVDPNQDGVVDFTEFLSLLVRNRQELNGERKSILTERGPTSPEGMTNIRLGRNSNDSASNSMGDTKLPFPRQKRFSRSDDLGASKRLSLPFQGLDDEAETASQQRTLFQEKVRSLFDDPDVIQVEDDAVKGAGWISGKQQSDDDANSFSSEDSSKSAEHSKARAAWRRMSVQETHLGLGLAGMLQQRIDLQKNSPLSIHDRIRRTVEKGNAAIAQHREQVDAAMQELEKHRQRKYIRTDDGLVEGNRPSGEDAIKQRNKMRIQRNERIALRQKNHTKQPAPRVAAMSQRAVDRLQREVSVMMDNVPCVANKLPSGAAAGSQLAHQPPRMPTPQQQTALINPRVSSTPDVTASNTIHAAQQRAVPKIYKNRTLHAEAPHERTTDVSAVRPPSVARPASIVRPLSTASGTGLPSQLPPTAPTPQITNHNRVPPEEAHRHVTLEDPLSLWKLLEANHRRMEAAHDVAAVDQRADASYCEGLATRRAFARTLASHLTLRVSVAEAFEHNGMSNVSHVTPATIHQTYIVGAPQPRGIASLEKQPLHGNNTAPHGSATIRHISAGGRKPSRPQTAPSQRQRPSSAKTSARDAQLSRPTNRSPHAPSLQAPGPASRPTSALPLRASGPPKQFGIGGAMDGEDGVVDDSDDVVYV